MLGCPYGHEAIIDTAIMLSHHSFPMSVCTVLGCKNKVQAIICVSHVCLAAMLLHSLHAQSLFAIMLMSVRLNVHLLGTLLVLVKQCKSCTASSSICKGCPVPTKWMRLMLLSFSAATVATCTRINQNSTCGLRSAMYSAMQNDVDPAVLQLFVLAQS